MTEIRCKRFISVDDEGNKYILVNGRRLPVTIDNNTAKNPLIVGTCPIEEVQNGKAEAMGGACGKCGKFATAGKLTID